LATQVKELEFWHGIAIHVFINLIIRAHTPYLKLFLLFAALVTIARSLVTLLGSSYTDLDHSTSRIHFHNTAQFYSSNRLYVASPRYTHSVASMLTNQPKKANLTLWRRNYFFLISAHLVYKMWIIQEPKKLALWNKLHFEEKKKTKSIEHV